MTQTKHQMPLCAYYECDLLVEDDDFVLRDFFYFIQFRSHSSKALWLELGVKFFLL